MLESFNEINEIMEETKTLIKIEKLSSKIKQKKKRKNLIGKVISSLRPQYTEKTVLEDINLECKQSRIIALVSENKKTLNYFVNLFDEETIIEEGTLLLNGVKPSKELSYASLVSIISSEDTRTWDELTTKEVIKLAKAKYQIGESELKKQRESLEDILELKDIISIQTRKLPIEKRFKCELYLALLHNPKLLIVKELPNDIDEKFQDEIREILKKINTNHKTTIMIATENMQDISELCTDIVIFNDKKVAYQGPIKALLEKYANYKYVEMKLDKQISKHDLEIYGRIVKYDLMEATIAIPREEQGRISSDIVTNLPVNDLKVVEPPLHDLIKDTLKAKSEFAKAEKIEN